jgi:flavin reductase (DIM6/NTAB) family NADH-FMN oxidoreductase RutF
MTADSQPSPQSGLSHALGKIPSGLFILTVRDGDRATGMLASWVQQAGFDPPTLTVAVKRGRFVADWIVSSGRFALSQLATGSRTLIRHFGRGFDEGTPAFEGLELRDDARGGPVLAAAIAYLDTELVAELTVPEGDHHLFLARIVGGDILDPGAEPFMHVRASGFHY